MADVVDAKRLPEGFSIEVYSAVIVAASVHRGRHEPEMIEFIKDHMDHLQHMRTVLLSVSLSEAGAEDPHATPERRAQAAADVERMIDDLVAETGWPPSKIKAVAGALMYTHYNRLVRFVMQMIAKKAGAATDTSKDHEYTDWAALDRLVDELLAPA
jgi:menaquinone-dependent protoporphyrinogen oxidase